MSDERNSTLPTEPGPNTGSLARPSASARSAAQVSFMGNTYDLTAVVAVVCGGIAAFSCLTCNMGYYCLPPVAIVLGLVGLLSAEESVSPDRTRLLSWLGIGGGALVLLLIVLGIMLYVGLIVLSVAVGLAGE